jgi:hypothetical protein
MRLRTAIVTMPGIPVLYVAGKRGKPIPEQASEAFQRLEERLASLRGRRFYGVVVGDEYRACVAVAPDDDIAALALSSWTLPGGRYARHKIDDWETYRDRIGPTIEALRQRPDFDPTRPCIEYYRSQRELLLQILVS